MSGKNKRKAIDSVEEVQTDGAVVKKEDDNVILRLMGLLFAALNCIYLQSGDDLRLTIGQVDCIHGKYRDVLTEDERHGECVRG